MSIYRYFMTQRQQPAATAGRHEPDQATPGGGPWCWVPDCLHRSRLIDLLCPVHQDDEATRARWETAMAEADIRRRQRENGAA